MIGSNFSKRTLTTFAIVAGIGTVALGSVLYGKGRDSPSSANESNHTDGEHGHKDSGNGGDEHGHGGEEAHDEGIVKKTVEELQALGATVMVAEAGTIATQITLQGALEPLPDSVGHIVPRIPGVVREVRKKLGDTVKKGETLAVLESRDLADAKSSWLAARERLSAAESAFKREESLWQKKITSEQDYLEAKKAASEARIEQNSAFQKLESLGLSPAQLSSTTGGAGSLVRYELKSPLAGIVVERHLTVGETTKTEEPAFVVAELSKINAVVQVYPKDLPAVRQGLKGTVTLSTGGQKTTGTVTFVSPILDAESRAAKAHLLIDNASGLFRPGLFVTAALDVDATEAAVIVSRDAIQKVENKDVVFVQTEEGFVPSPLELGRSNATHVEVLSGLEAGEKFVAKGSFLLKAEAAKAQAGHDHDH
jgi:cobalt-zinc-cadmium efflux system membrane fusion protein